MCSPARHPDAAYQAVSSLLHRSSRKTDDQQYGHSLVVNPLGEIIAEADENGATVIADIGMSHSQGLRITETQISWDVDNVLTRCRFRNAGDYEEESTSDYSKAIRRLPERCRGIQVIILKSPSRSLKSSHFLWSKDRIYDTPASRD